jgi:hypothetical protein
MSPSLSSTLWWVVNSFSLRLVPVAIKADKARQQEDRVYGFLLVEILTPVPGGGQTTVDTRASLEEVVGAWKSSSTSLIKGTSYARAKKKMAEEDSYLNHRMHV